MKRTVLIVDDEKDLVDLIRYHLEKAGLCCLEARDGESALLLGRERIPDLIVLDLMLPGIDGLEVCRRLRKDPKTANISIIIAVILMSTLFALTTLFPGAFRSGL